MKVFGQKLKSLLKVNSGDYCSFCGTKRHFVGAMVVGREAAICDECAMKAHQAAEIKISELQAQEED